MNAEEMQTDQQHDQQNNQMPPQHEPTQEQPGQLSETQQLINMMQEQMYMMKQTQSSLLAVSSENLQLRQQLAEKSGSNGTWHDGSNSTQGPARRPQTKKPERPVVETDVSETEWAVFLDSWQRYKTMCDLTDVQDIRNELRLTCSAAVNRRLISTT